jgi:hypothetical protein
MSVSYIDEATLAEGSHNGSAAVLKTADRKVMQVRVLSPPPLTFILWLCILITNRFLRVFESDGQG